MESIFSQNLIILIILTGVVLLIFYLNWQNKKKSLEKQDQTMLQMIQLLKQDIESLRQRFEHGLGRTTDEINRRLDQATQAYNQMTRELATVQEIGRQMRHLQDFLKSPKLRGNIGEQILKDLLEQILPQNIFQFQYRFRTGEIVDAIIKTSRGLIPIDSKFPLENFQKYSRAETEEERNRFLKEFHRDIKKHIDAISKKYILPQEGTVDFAVMYIPSEAVYYEVGVHHQDLIEYAQQKKVLPLSPNNFYYFLKIILMSLEGAKIEEASRRIWEGLKTIRNEAEKLGRDLDILTTHINHSKNASDKVNQSYQRLVSRIDQVDLIKSTEETKKLPVS